MMKNFTTLTLLLTTIVIFFAACNNNAKKTEPKAATPNSIMAEPPQNAAGVWHYICSKRCAGGSGAEGSCTNCGAPLLHNTLYHANTNNTAPSLGAPFATPPTSAPGQNAAGIWHYSCDKGCAGGSATAGNCVSCGNTLTHNQAYH